MYSIEEITLINLYSGMTVNRKNVINSLKNIVDDIDEDEALELTKRTIRKLTATNDDDFNKIDFSLASEYEDEI